MIEKPPCFDTQEQFNGWVELATYLGIEEPETNYCIDCLPAFKNYALERGLCSFPSTFFINTTDEDGEQFVLGIGVV
jgi:hypothetical protein